MKKASQIINSLQNKPQFSKLLKYKCIAKIQSMFMPLVQKMIKFAYIKNETLFFVFSHPAGKQEFDNSIQNIKSALKFHTPQECSENVIRDIKAFVTHTPPTQTQTPQQKKELFYPERAKGDFEITVHDEKLHTLITSIQKIIKEKQCN
jgi:hypothetical protein